MTGPFPGVAGPISLQQVQTKHRQFERAHTAMVDRECDDGGRHAKNHVYQHPYFKPRSGKLQAGTEYRVIKTRGGRRVRVLNRKPYAAAIDRGARSHPITARRAKALRFTWPRFWSIATRSPVWFLKSVNHPGNRPYRFLWKATYSAYRITGQSLRVGMARLATKF